MIPRRSRFRPWRVFFAVLGAWALSRWIWESLDQRPLHPTAVSIAPGEYTVRRTRDDGVIEVLLDEAMPPRRAWVQVRLLGIELADHPQAVRLLRELIADRGVRLQFDRRRLDDDGFLLAYMFAGSQLLNAELVRLGFARPDPHDADFGTLVRQIAQAEAEARAHRRGVWAGPGAAFGTAGPAFSDEW